MRTEPDETEFSRGRSRDQRPGDLSVQRGQKPRLQTHRLYVCPKDSEELRRHYETVITQLSAKALRCLVMAGKLELGALADYDGPKHPAHK